jgi:hypothetical protein
LTLQNQNMIKTKGTTKQIIIALIMLKILIRKEAWTYAVLYLKHVCHLDYKLVLYPSHCCFWIVESTAQQGGVFSSIHHIHNCNNCIPLINKSEVSQITWTFLSKNKQQNWYNFTNLGFLKVMITWLINRYIFFLQKCHMIFFKKLTIFRLSIADEMICIFTMFEVFDEDMIIMNSVAY